MEDGNGILDAEEKAARYQRRGYDRWHIEKKISLGVIGFLLVQTVAFVVFMTRLSGNVETLIKGQDEYKIERYTREDARRDRELYTVLFDNSRRERNELERRLSILENAVSLTRPR